MLTSFPFTIANYPVTGHADRDRCPRESELPYEKIQPIRVRAKTILNTLRSLNRHLITTRAIATRDLRD